MGCTASSGAKPSRSCSAPIASRSCSGSIGFREKYAFHEKLSQGAFAEVRVCVHCDTGRECAVKILQAGGSEESRLEAQRECLLMRRLAGHPNVVSLLDNYNDDRYWYLVIEKCEHSLCDMLLANSGVQEKHLLCAVRQMLLGLAQCHSMHVVHRDVKQDNFLVSNEGVVKLCDFGLATHEKPDGIFGIAGTAHLMSPEMVIDRPYNQKTDVWSLGATAYAMLFGRYPFKMEKDRYPHLKSETLLMRRAIAENSPPPTYVAHKGSPQPSDAACEFVQALLQRDPKLRPSARECLLLEAQIANAARTSKKASQEYLIPHLLGICSGLCPLPATCCEKRESKKEGEFCRTSFQLAKLA